MSRANVYSQAERKRRLTRHARLFQASGYAPDAGTIPASFIQEHMYDRFFDIGGHSKSGWVMQWCMNQIDESDLPQCWRPSEIRESRAAEFAWQNNLCDSDWPNQD